MRVDQRAIVALLLVSPTAQAFVPRNLIVQKRAGVVSSVAVPCIENMHTELHDLDEFDYDDAGRLEYTNTILDTENNPPGSLKQEVLASVFPLLWAWGRTETKEGATTVELVLERLEQEEEAGNDLVLLNNKHYTVAVDAWGKSGHEDSATRAERILQKMVEMGKTRSWLAPTRVTYNAVMNAYSKQGNTERTSYILEQMEESSTLTPNTNDYNALLGAYAKLGKAREAEDVLKRMVDRCKVMGDPCECTPDLYSYNILLDAWAKSNERGRGKRAEAILKAVQDQSDSGELSFQPDARTYSAAICAIVRSNEKDAVLKAQEILAQAEAKGIEADDYLHTALLAAYASSGKPDSAEKAEELLYKWEGDGPSSHVAYNTVLKAWKESNNDDASSRAEAILKRMEELNIADTISYTTVIATYANKGTTSAAKRAEEILEMMKEAGATPNTQTLNAVMNAWIRSGDILRAERILDKMERAFHEGAGNVLPTVVSYSTIMNGWAKSRDPQAVEKAEEVFDRMTAMYKAGNEEARPNLFSFVTLINTIVKSRQIGSPERAEKILFEMYEEYKQGNGAVKPNTMLVTSVIDCWQKSGDRDAGEKAEALLDWLIEIYRIEKDETLGPNAFSFSSSISAWAKSRKFGKAARARAVLTKMMKLHESGQIRAKPNTHCFTAVINSCAHCENDEFAKSEALQIAVNTYKELVDSDFGGPNQVTFSALITVFRNIMPQSQKRSTAVTTIFRKCAEEGHVDSSVLQKVESTLNLEELRKLVGNAVSGDGRVDVKALPTEWRRNTRVMPPRNNAFRQNSYAAQRP